MDWTHDGYLLTDDPARADLDRVCALLADTYWAAGRSRAAVELSVRSSLCFSLFHGPRQVGMARVLTDQGAASYLCDVVLDPAHRSRGVGRWLMERVLDHPAVRRTRALLITRDAQPFYRRLGFVTHPYECMVKTEGAVTFEPAPAAQRPRMKICCIATVEEARMAIAAGADALGLVPSMPGGPGVIPLDDIARIARRVPPPIATFLLISERDTDAIVALHRRCGTTAVQVCDRLRAGTHADLRAAMPGVTIVQVVHVRGAEAVDEAIRIGPHVDALLLDSGHPARGELGGTGRTYDWQLSAEIRAAVEVPVFLAGGVRPENVADAIAQVRPWAVDVCSGVRTDGRLDAGKLGAFARACSAADAAAAHFPKRLSVV